MRKRAVRFRKRCTAAAGEYDLEITATETGGRIHKFPKSEGDVFGTLVMRQSKAAE